jgi:hypothetical protein
MKIFVREFDLVQKCNNCGFLTKVKLPFILDENATQCENCETYYSQTIREINGLDLLKGWIHVILRVASKRDLLYRGKWYK